MKKTAQHSPVSALLLNWYKEHKRELPWRGSTNPYIVWISEIILQQTRVNQGWDYFLRFTKRFPDTASLAGAGEDEVLKLWQGLGYYSRARNMHAAAKQIMDEFGGSFPAEHARILSLKGVGEYTAAAIASIAFGQPYAVVDGNVFRVIARLFAVETPVNTGQGKKIVAEIARSLLDADNPGEYNQAIMDFGAIMCTPSLPDCEHCPLRMHCMAFETKKVTDFPVKIRRKNVKNRYFHYIHIVHGEKTYIQKRGKSDIWKNLYEFPLIETAAETDFTLLTQEDAFRLLFGTAENLSVEHAMRTKHVLSHQVIYANFYRITIPPEIHFNTPQHCTAIEVATLHDYPVSRLTHKYLEIL